MFVEKLYMARTYKKRIEVEEVLLDASTGEEVQRTAYSKYKELPVYSEGYVLVYEPMQNMVASKEIHPSTVFFLISVLMSQPLGSAEFRTTAIDLQHACAASGLSRSFVKKCIIDLEALGIIEKVARAHYRVNPIYLWRGSAQRRREILKAKTANKEGSAGR